MHYYWLLDIETPRIELDVIPDNAVDLVFSPQIEDFSMLYFPADAHFSIPLTGPVYYAGVCFKVDQASYFFARSLQELRELPAGEETTDALNLGELLSQIRNCFEPSKIAECLNHFFLQYRPSESPLSTSIFEQFLNSAEPECVKRLAQQSGISERQFRRLTTDLFGLSPKKILGIQRLQAALRELLEADKPTLDDHYYDDSHRIKELKKLTGLTPGEIRRMAEIYNTRK